MEEQSILDREFVTLASHYRQEEKLLSELLSRPAENNLKSRSRVALAQLERARIRHRISLVELASSSWNPAEYRKNRKLFAKNKVPDDLPAFDSPSFLQRLDEEDQGELPTEDDEADPLDEFPIVPDLFDPNEEQL